MRYVLTVIIAFLVVAFCPGLASAQGWNDYQLQVDPGFEIVRANSLDVDLCRSGGSLVYFHGDFPGVGPISGYVVTPTHIFTRHQGRVPRNLFAGDTFENVDPSKTFYFVVDKAAANTPGKFGFGSKVTIDGVPQDDGRPKDVFGPFDEQTFLRQLAVQASVPITWIEPSNPNVVTPIAGSLMFLAISAVVLGWPILLIILVVVVGYVLWRRRSRGRAAAG
jgi:hypothetical protein